jgi:DNA mismatch endonuclease, patch repair protein
VKGRRRAPTFKSLTPASAKASLTKRRNRSIGTLAERRLRQVLWANGARYRINDRTLPGVPDLVFRARRLVVFVDGDFWHGRNWRKLNRKLADGYNSSYWIEKIAYNRKRDVRINKLLRRQGFDVVRLWETDVIRSPFDAAAFVIRVLRARRFASSRSVYRFSA